MRGTVHSHDHLLLVRKRGDPALVGAPGGAPCCRSAPGVVAQQLGRPISDAEFGSAAAARQAAALGWSADYLSHEELEAERLFDYASLAPAAPAHPLALLTCQDTRLAGAGSPLLPGATDALAHHSVGRGKRLAIVPGGYDWARSADQVCGGLLKGACRGADAFCGTASNLPLPRLPRLSCRLPAKATGLAGTRPLRTDCPLAAAAPAPPPVRAPARCS